MLFLRHSVESLTYVFVTDSIGLFSFIFSGALRKTNLFCQSAFRPFKVI